MRAAFALLFLLAPATAPDAAQRIREMLRAETGVIELPAGDIAIASEIALPDKAHDLEIRGAASGTTLHAAPNFRGRALLSVRDGVNVRFVNFSVDGNREAIAKPAGLPEHNVPFAKFTVNNGILVQDSSGVTVSKVRFRNIAGFAVMAGASSKVRVEDCEVRDSGSRNAAKRNNTTGGILLEEGTSDFAVLRCELSNILGNGIWTHSLYPSPRNTRGQIAGNILAGIGRDAIQVGHATHVRVEENRGERIGYPVEDVDVEGHAIPVGIDTAGNVEQSVYARNQFAEVNGKCIDLDGFHDGEVTGNICVNRQGPEQYRFGNFGISFNNTNPDMQSRNIRVTENVIDGALFGGVFLIGTGHTVSHNRLLRLNLAHCNEDRKYGCEYGVSTGEPDFLRSGIYLARKAERPAPARANTIEANEISGYGMGQRCIGAAPGVSLKANKIAGNECSDDEVLSARGRRADR